MHNEPVERLFLLSQYHLLIESNSNITVAATALVPSIWEDPAHQHSHQAIISRIDKTNIERVLFCSEGEGIFWLQNDTIVHVTHRNLEAEVKELIVNKIVYREAFSLLALVAKNVNYCFKFTYRKKELGEIVEWAVRMATATIIPALSDKIILFRVGWVVQLCVECGEETLIW